MIPLKTLDSQLEGEIQQILGGLWGTSVANEDFFEVISRTGRIGEGKGE